MYTSPWSVVVVSTMYRNQISIVWLVSFNRNLRANSIPMNQKLFPLLFFHPKVSLKFYIEFCVALFPTNRVPCRKSASSWSMELSAVKWPWITLHLRGRTVWKRAADVHNRGTNVAPETKTTLNFLYPFLKKLNKRFTKAFRQNFLFGCFFGVIS